MALASSLALLTSLALPLPQPPLQQAGDDVEVVGGEESSPDEEFELDARDVFRAVRWQEGPLSGDLGSRAKIDVPQGMLFTDGPGARGVLRDMGNLVGENELGLITMPDLSWFVVFEFDESGYVKDDEKDEIDADELLESLRENQELANEELSKLGMSTLTIEGWARPPYYDTSTNNLEWATRLLSSEGGRNLNHNSRALGRKGVMSITLVVDDEIYDEVLPQFHGLLKGFGYRSGERYSEFTSGDKVAKYGLTALVAGGAGALAAKTGLLGKFWKLILGAFVAVGALFKKIFGGGKSRPARRDRAARRESEPELEASEDDPAPEASDASRH